MRKKENIEAAIGRRRDVKTGTGLIERMYPKVKVKVRVQDLDDHDDDLGFSCCMMTSPGEYRAASPECVIRVPTARLLKEQLHPTQESKVVGQKDKKSEEFGRLSTRAASVARPRAVLSSPDNDEIIGSTNSKRVIQPSPLRNPNMLQKPLVEHKTTPLQLLTESPADRRYNCEMIGSKNSKRVVHPSPLRNHNMIQIRDVELKTSPSANTIETPACTRRLPSYAVNDHTPPMTDSVRNIKGKPKTAKDQNLPKMKQSGIVASSQKARLRSHIANIIV